MIPSDPITELIESYYTPLNDTLARLRKQSESDRIPLILKETEMFLRTVLQLFPVRRVLEIGTAYGYSAIFFGMLCPEAQVTTIEISDDNYRIACDNIRELGLSYRIQCLHGEASAVLDRLIEHPSAAYPSSGTSFQENRSDETREPYDLIFIDASKSHYRDFFDRAEQLATDGALIVCDNILMHSILVDASLDRRRRHRTSVKRMHEFLHYIDQREDLDASLLRSGDGLLLIRKNTQHAD